MTPVKRSHSSQMSHTSDCQLLSDFIIVTSGTLRDSQGSPGQPEDNPTSGRLRDSQGNPGQPEDNPKMTEETQDMASNLGFPGDWGQPEPLRDTEAA